MYRILFLCLLTAFCCALCAGADSSFLPDHFGPWQAEAPARTIQTNDLEPLWTKWRHGQAILREAGLGKIEGQTFRSGNDEIPVRLFALRDPSSAYEFYTFLLAPGMKDLGLGKDSAGEGDVPVVPNTAPGTITPIFADGPHVANSRRTVVLIGNLVLETYIPVNVKPDSLKELVAQLHSNADPTPLPPLKVYLPEHWRVFGSEKYALGPEAFRAAMSSLQQDAAAGLANEVGFKDGVEAILAGYRGQHGSGILLLLDYPTPQLAEQHLHHLQQALPASLKRSGVTVERKASLLSVVFAPTAPEHAQAIRDEVNYETEVTWNESSHKATDPPIFTIMFKIFLFTGLFLGVATGVGIAFGGFRVIIKRLFPGKVFDRPEDIEVLQLGLSGKKIDPTDMY